jgi:hypothetical protein
MKMFSKVPVILATSALLLGIAHLAFGVIAYEGFSLELLWFLGTGVAMIVTALANFKNKDIWILRFQNGLMLGFVVALVILAPEPQVWLGLIFFAGLFITSCMKPQP